MPSSFEITVPLDIPREALWRLRGTKTFMEFLVANGALNRMDASPLSPSSSDDEYDDTDDGAKRLSIDSRSATAQSRLLTYVPAELTIPDVIKPIVDDSYIEISDTQTWDDVRAPFRQASIIKPNFLGDVISTSLTLSLDPDPDHSDSSTNPSCLHTLAGRVTVVIPFLGYYVEQAVITNMRNFYSSYPRHVSEFVDMLVKRFGNGTRDSLDAAVDKLLAHEKAL